MKQKPDNFFGSGYLTNLAPIRHEALKYNPREYVLLISHHYRQFFEQDPTTYVAFKNEEDKYSYAFEWGEWGPFLVYIDWGAFAKRYFKFISNDEFVAEHFVELL